MPELPDINAYLEALQPRIVGRQLRRVRIKSPFVLRTFDPAIQTAQGRTVTEVLRIGKRIAIGLEGDLFLVIHLMIAGRLRWKDGAGGGVGGYKPGRIDLAAFEFDSGLLTLTEASQKKRASVHLFSGRGAALAVHAGGVDVMTCSPAEFAAAMRVHNRTVKRALTDPSTVDGVGNAYSDEILHAARLSPTKLTGSMDDAELAALHATSQRVLSDWTARLRAEFAGRFPAPGQITAFRPDFAVHGRFGKPCPVCGAPIQRIVRSENEFNYCPGCQTGGRILADRSLSRLLKDDWPRTLDDLEEHS